MDKFQKKFQLMLNAYYGGDENAYEEYKRFLKKEKRRKIFVTVACLLIVAFTIVAVVAFNSYDNRVRNYCELELSSDKTYYVVTEYKGQDAQVTIPSAYRGKPIKSIGYKAFCDNNSIEIVIIPDSVTTIEDNAFAGCTSLVDVLIPSSVTSIGDYAFSNCSSLVVVTLPDSISNIGAFAFGDCNSIYKFVFEGTQDQWEAINKAENWVGDNGFYVVYCYDVIIFHSD